LKRRYEIAIFPAGGDVRRYRLLRFRAVLLVAVCFLVFATARAEVLPEWAYPVLDPSVKPYADDGPHSLAGSAAQFTWPQLYNSMVAADWFPESHPPMPAAVARGTPPDVYACGMCHQPNGAGRPENASLAGLPAAYILQQLADMKSGARRSSGAEAGPEIRMVSSAAHVAQADAEAAAAYFAALPYRPTVRVVETERVPVTALIAGSLRAPVAGAGSEPIGQRVIEIPEDLERVKLHDPRATFIAYVPPGSIARGEAIAAGAGGSVPCATCHGAALQGQVLGEASVPPIAGRSALYIVRQLYDIRHGARAGAWSALMAPVVAGMELEDMIAVAAYVASRPVVGAP